MPGTQGTPIIADVDPHGRPGPAQTPSVARETAEDIADGLNVLATGTAQSIVDDARSRVAALVLLALMVPVGIMVLIISFVVIAGVYAFVGAPSGPVGSVVTIVWLLATLAALFLVFRALYRRMPRRLRTAYATPMEPTAADHGRLPLTGLAGADSVDEQLLRHATPPPSPTLSELDARLAPRQLPLD